MEKEETLYRRSSIESDQAGYSRPNRSRDSVGVDHQILVGVFCGIVAMIVAGPIWGSICGKKFNVPVPERVASQENIDESKLPKFGTIVGIILIPLVLIILSSITGVVPALSGV